MSADDVVTAITQARTNGDAIGILAGLSKGLLASVADLLYVDEPTVRRTILACVQEAMA